MVEPLEGKLDTPEKLRRAALTFERKVDARKYKDHTEKAHWQCLVKDFRAEADRLEGRGIGSINPLG